MKVHPFAERFPMLAQEQLQELADDISEHGQVYPVIIDANGQLLDGRNRLAACKLAKVEPRIETWSGDNPIAYILSVNVHRRHIPKSVQVMAVALAYPEPAKRGGDRKSERFKGEISKSAADFDVRRESLIQARMILREFGADSEQVKFVMQGGSLEDTYQKAKEKKEAQEEYDKRVKELTEQFKVLATKPVLNVQPADLSLKIDDVIPTEKVTPKEFLDAQFDFTRSLIAIGERLDELRNKIPEGQTDHSSAWTVAVRSSVAHIISYANAIANGVNELKEKQTKIRRVR